VADDNQLKHILLRVGAAEGTEQIAGELKTIEARASKQENIHGGGIRGESAIAE
jgi:hypothetical protein